MFLLQMKNLQVSSYSLRKISRIRLLIKKITNLKKPVGFLDSFIPIKYLITFTVFRKNYFMCLTDSKRNVLIKISLGRKLKKKNRFFIIKRIFYRLHQSSLYKHLAKIGSNNDTAVYFKNTNKLFAQQFVKLLLIYRLKVVSQILDNKIPHNGCRPKKIRRTKKSRLSFNTKPSD